MPDPKLIAHQIPNPNGWSTGMEDSMLNSGLMASALTSLYERFNDHPYLRLARFSDLISGLPYYNHSQDTRPGNGTFYPLHDLGDAAALVLLCPGRSCSAELAETICTVSHNIDYSLHCIGESINLIHAHALCMQ